jgi:anthranilate synthase component 1
MARYTSVPVEGLPRFSGGAVGWFGYDSIRLVERIPDKNAGKSPAPLDEIFFGFYRELIVFDNREHRLLVIVNIFTEENKPLEKLYDDVRYRIGSLCDRMAVRLSGGPVSIKQRGSIRSNMTRQEYEAAVERCKEYIRAGDIFQVVPSQAFSVDVEASPFDLYRTLRIVNPSPYMFFLACGDASVIGASPEMMVRVEGRTAEVRPIAGTRPRGRDAREDDLLEKELLADPKENAEHIMLVDLGRNDLGRVCDYGSVAVEEMRHIERYSHVMHLVSNIKGTLQSGRDAIDALFSCFPAGTLSGAPKIRAMEIIDELENTRRGIYGGALGYIDFHGNLDSCIVIRTLVYSNGVATIQAGAGIVADSVPDKEYDETVNKASALFSAIKDAGKIMGKE